MTAVPAVDTHRPLSSAWSAQGSQLFRLLGRNHRQPAPSASLALGLPLGLALVMGALVGFAELNALAVCVALLACVFILLEFRLGVVCLIVLMPLSASAMFPHSIGGITGLNPLNLLLVVTLASLLMDGRGTGAAALIPLRPLAWRYVLPIVVAGMLGTRHLGDVSADLAAVMPGEFDSVAQYLLNLLFKPLFIVLFALLVAAACARSRRPALFIVPMVVSVWAMCLLTISFVFQSGASLSQLASSGSRTFFTPLGIHANDLGRLYAVAYALMLYTCAVSRDATSRLVLIASMLLVVLALVLTFSRGAFFGFAVVNVLFLLSRRKFLTLLLGCTMLLGLVMVLPGAVFDRIASGWGDGINTISAGRVADIWLPLLPELWRSPIIGNGLSSIAWSDAMRGGSMLTVGHAHNAYLGAALDMGLLGLALVCAYFVHVWRGFRRLSSDAAMDPLLRGFYAGAAAGLLSFLLAGFFGSSLLPCMEQIFLWFAIGMMYGQRRPEPAPC